MSWGLEYLVVSTLTLKKIGVKIELDWELEAKSRVLKGGLG